MSTMVSWLGSESGSEFPQFNVDFLQNLGIMSILSQNEGRSWQDGPIISDQIYSGSQSSLSYSRCFAGWPGGG